MGINTMTPEQARTIDKNWEFFEKAQREKELLKLLPVFEAARPENRDVIRAYGNGAAIYDRCGERIDSPSFNGDRSGYTYRTHDPYDATNVHILVGTVVRNKKTRQTSRVESATINLNKSIDVMMPGYGSSITVGVLLNDFEFPDGTPCGTLLPSD